MDNVVENIIAIRKRDISKANEAFADLDSFPEFLDLNHHIILKLKRHFESTFHYHFYLVKI